MKESEALKAYVKYIPKRIAYLKMLNGGVPSSEYKYWCELRKRIKQWGETHVIFYACLYGKIDAKFAISLCGVPERTFFRIMSKQRKQLMSSIEKWEKQLTVEYPFIPVTDIFQGSL